MKSGLGPGQKELKKNYLLHQFNVIMPCVYVGKVVVSAMHFLPSSSSSGIGV